MTIEQRQQLDQSAFDAAKSVEQRDKPISTAIERSHVAKWFKIGAQTILDNPKEWGLQDIEDSDERWCEVVDNFKQEADLYRRVLEDVDIELSHEGYANSSGEGVDKARTIIKEALKQQDDENNSGI